jgi:hypothetical protein
MQYYYPPYYGPIQDTLGQFKAPYQMQQMPMQPQQPQRQPGSDFIWVQGEAGAKAYLVAPGSTVILWDSESPTIYIKSADATGMPNMKVLEFTERTEAAHKCQCAGRYVTAEQFNELKAEFEKLKEGMVAANG